MVDTLKLARRLESEVDLSRENAERAVSILQTMLAEAELEAWLERFDPDLGALSPASEEFIGGLVKKAKSVVRKVATVAKTVGKLASPLLMPMLGKLRGLVRPLLEQLPEDLVKLHERLQRIEDMLQRLSR